MRRPPQEAHGLPLSGTTDPDAPHQRYYTACIGSWSAPARFVVDDPAAFRASERASLDSLGLRLMGSGFLAGLRMSTTVARLGPNDFQHTTRLHVGPLTLIDSVEQLTLLDDEKTVQLVGEARRGALPGRHPVVGQAVVDAEAVHADYVIDWFGEPLRQRTRREGDRVDLRQEGQGWTAFHPLIRQ